MWLVDLYAPYGVDLGEGDSLSYWCDTVKSMGLGFINDCKVSFDGNIAFLLMYYVTWKAYVYQVMFH